MTKSAYKYLIALAIPITLAGCDAGIMSKKPILSKNESDSIENAVGYWKCKERSGRDAGRPILIEDDSTGTFFKDRKYKVKALSGKQEEQDFSVMRAKKLNNTYAIQGCTEEREKIECVYAYIISSDNGFNLYPTHDINLSKAVKDVLADVYVNAKKRDEIQLPDGFVASKGKALIEALSKSQPKADLTDEFFICEKISIDKARELVDKQRAEEERRWSEASERNKSPDQ
jgi:hypothetical protein